MRITGASELAFPAYDGNGMFRSLGNIVANPAVGLLFIDFESPRRLRVNGEASIADDDPLLAELPGAQLVVRVRAQKIFPNCPRYIHRASGRRTLDLRPARRPRTARAEMEVDGLRGRRPARPGGPPLTRAVTAPPQ